MLFNSLHFCLFLPTIVVLAWTLRRNRTARTALLLAASYYFYMSWNWRYAGLLLASTLLDFVVGLQLPQARSTAARKLLLLASVAGNLGILLYFKYFNFFWDSATTGVELLGHSMPDLTHSFLLPVGISFYTFQSLSYTIDVYRGSLTPTRSFMKFALFVSFFPQLVAGPIVRASEFLPQLERHPAFSDDEAQRGLFLILVGLFKKVCLADVLAATLVDRVFAAPGSFGSLELLLAAYGYTFQIYCDFSGYSDIAIGAGALLGYKLPINFNRPFLAISIRDFWHRWHISLSTWLRDYLYIPLGGSRRSTPRTYANLATTMLLGGLWHGANWTFVIWGAMHGAYLSIERALGIDRKKPADMGAGERFIRRVVTFHLVVFTFLVFRCDNIVVFGDYLARLTALDAAQTAIPVLFFVALAVAALTHFGPTRLPEMGMDRFVRQPAYRQAVILTGSLALFTMLSVPNAPFIYFQF